jgi:drug/metabolite transporter (DMT)-like permease
VTLTALLLVLASAAAHALWNMLARSSRDKLAFNVGMNAVQAVATAPLAAYFWVVAPPALPALAILPMTFLINLVYYLVLAAVYNRTDLSLSYPIMRGTAVLFSALGGFLFWGDRVPQVALVSIALVAAGILVAHGRGGGVLRGAVPSFAEPISLLLSLAGGFMASAATVWDKLGVVHFHPLLYHQAAAAGSSLFLVPYVLRTRKPAFYAVFRHELARVIACGLLNSFSYVLVLYALTFTEVTYVTTAREVSIVFGALLGALLLHEPQGARRTLGAAVILAGVLVLAFSR